MRDADFTIVQGPGVAATVCGVGVAGRGVRPVLVGRGVNPNGRAVAVAVGVSVAVGVIVAVPSYAGARGAFGSRDEPRAIMPAPITLTKPASSPARFTVTLGLFIIHHFRTK